MRAKITTRTNTVVGSDKFYSFVYMSDNAHKLYYAHDLIFFIS